jgi:hypothetical protein
LPFSKVSGDLSTHLQAAHSQLDDWTFERIVAEGGYE